MVIGASVIGRLNSTNTIWYACKHWIAATITRWGGHCKKSDSGIFQALQVGLKGSAEMIITNRRIMIGGKFVIELIGKGECGLVII